MILHRDLTEPHSFVSIRITTFQDFSNFAKQYTNMDPSFKARSIMPESMSVAELEKLIKKLEKQMKKAAAELNFEAAAELRDKLIELKKHLNEME